MARRVRGHDCLCKGTANVRTYVARVVIEEKGESGEGRVRWVRGKRTLFFFWARPIAMMRGEDMWK